MLRTSIAAAFLAVSGLASGGSLTLDVTPDDTVTAGSTVSVSVGGTNPGDLVFLAFGQTTGNTAVDLGIASFDLGLAMPFGLLPLPGDVSFEVPAVPAAAEGTTLNLQAFSLGFEFGGGAPTATASTSNLDSLSF